MSRKAYPTDLTDAEWQLIEPLLPALKEIGHPSEVDYRPDNKEFHGSVLVR